MVGTVVERSSPRHEIEPAEWDTRVKLAAVYRIFAQMGMDDLIYTHISAAVPGPAAHFLLNPFGLMYEEVTASNLVKIDWQGEIVGASEHPVNYAGFVIHGAVHAAVADAGCVIHLHTDAGCAVAAQRGGLLPVSQFALFNDLGVAYHDYEGLALDTDEQARLVADLGDRTKMILRNHGLLTVGRTIAEAFFHMYNLERACRIQVLAQAGGAAELVVPSDAVLRKTAAQQPTATTYDGLGELELAAWMRKLDREQPDYRD